ncbi:MAG: DUF2382 domain-containing protein [Gemmatimonadaceae bacterium]
MVDDSANALADREVGDVPSRVAPLSELDEFEIADGYPEVRGWDVRDSTGRSIGYVYDLLVDVEAMRARYLDVLLDAEFAESDADQRVLIPVERVALDGSSDDVLLRGIDAAEVRALVPYAHRGVAREPEVSAPQAAGFADLGSPPPVVESELPRAPHYDDERLFTRDRAAAASPPLEAKLSRAEEIPVIEPREVTVADVAVRTVVETERVRERVPLARDEVEVERRAVRPGEDIRALRTHGDEIHIPIMAEELVVEKRLVAKEVLIIRKRTVTEEQTVEAEVRREQVQIDDPLGRVRSVGASGGPEGRA